MAFLHASFLAEGGDDLAQDITIHRPIELAQE
jgi:hypothetical protein